MSAASSAIYLNRRDSVRVMAASALSSLLPAAVVANEPPMKSRLGLVLYCARFRRDALRRKDADFDLYSPESFLQYCQSVGAGGMQCALGVLDADAARQLRDYAGKHDLYIEAIVKLPSDDADIARFDAEMQSAVSVGARAARTTIIPGRRYEYFDSIEMFNEYDARGRRMLERGAPIAEKFRLPIAVENHKDHRDDQRVALFEHISSEFVGACVDTGNSFALLEDPIETVTKLAPWAHSVHLKDQALQPYEDGFLLADIPLGQGGLDLKRMVQILKTTRPDVRFTLELITRDPLKVPCLTDRYWTTFPELPAADLARAMRYVRDHSSQNLQYVSRMSPDEQLAREDANVRESLDYARDQLGI